MKLSSYNTHVYIDMRYMSNTVVYIIFSKHYKIKNYFINIL